MNLKQTEKIFNLYAHIFFTTNPKYGHFEATERRYMDEKIWQDANQVFDYKCERFFDLISVEFLDGKFQDYEFFYYDKDTAKYRPCETPISPKFNLNDPQTLNDFRLFVKEKFPEHYDIVFEEQKLNHEKYARLASFLSKTQSYITNETEFKDSICVKICTRNEDIGGIKNILGDPERDYPTNCDQEKFYDFKISLI